MHARTADKAKTLDGRHYATREIYDAETESIFSKHWLYAGRLSSLERPGLRTGPG